MLQLIFLCVCCVLWLSRPRSKENEPPLLKGWWPIIGHSHIFLGNTTYFWNMFKLVSTACANAGGVVLMDIGFKPYYFITDPQDALTVANMCTNKHFAYDFPKRWLGKGLITASGPIWKNHRKMLLPAFSTQVSSSYQGIISDQARKLVTKLSDKVGAGKFDISVYLKEMAAENICYTKTKPLLELLIELSGNGLSDQEVREEIDTVITASLDTTAWVLNYTLIYLGANTEVQDRVYNEIEEVLGAADRDVEKNDLPKLVYMEIVLKEILRLHTTGQVTMRTLEKDIPLKNCTLRAGGHCMISVYGVHRDPCWGKDPDSFAPERWMEPGIKDNVFAGFSLGRRNCIGKPYAMMSLKTALCYFLRRYKVAATTDDLQFKLDFILKPVSGHLVSIENR